MIEFDTWRYPQSMRLSGPRSLGLGFSTLLCVATLSACSDDSLETAEGDDLGDEYGDEYGDEFGDDEAGAGETGGGDGGDSGGAEGGGEGAEGGEPGQLTAGEWRDLDHWDFWQGLSAQGSEWFTALHKWGFDTTMRIPVMALADGEPAANVEVTIRDANDEVRWRARTDNEGHAEMWPGLFGGPVEAPLVLSAAGQTSTLDTLPDGLGLDPVVFEVGQDPGATGLDLMFVVDTTGSMGDELSYLQVELQDVITRVGDEVGEDVDLRLSVNFYRDTTDEYVVRPFAFTDDVPLALSQLAAQDADGGGDWEEAVEAGLANGIYDHQWRGEARSRLLFLILDAPPHDTAQNRDVLAGVAEDAAAMGVRIIPVGASGIDKDTEFLLRNLDIATGGTYTFLTSDSGIGGEHLEPSVGEYDVELFNDMLVRLIADSMS